MGSQERGNSKLRQCGGEVERAQPRIGQGAEGRPLAGFTDVQRLEFIWYKVEAAEVFEPMNFFCAASLKLLYMTHGVS